MIDRINTLIEVNLSLLFTAENNSLKLKYFKDDAGNRLQHAKVFAGIMQKKELINSNPDEDLSFELTPFGKHIAENGGWLEHLKKLKIEENQNLLNEVQNSEITTKPFNGNLYIIALIIVLLVFLIALIY